MVETLEWMQMEVGKSGRQEAELSDVGRWPFKYATAEPTGSGLWTVWLAPTKEDREVNLGRYGTEARAKAAAGAAVEVFRRLEAGEPFTWYDDFGRVLFEVHR